MSDRKLDDWLTSYLHFVDNTEPPRIYKHWAGISAISATLGRRVWLDWDKRIFPNMYVILAGPSGCRKGTAMYPARDILINVDAVDMAAESVTKEKLAYSLSMKNSKSLDPTTGNMEPTAEKLIWSEELTVFIGRKEFELLQWLTDWYDCKSPWTYDTKSGDEQKISGLCISLFGATTPNMIQESLPEEAIGGGLTSRFIWVYGDKKDKLVPFPFKTAEEQALREDLIYDLNVISRLTGAYEVTTDFIDMWRDWYPEQERNPPFRGSRLERYCERRATHILKLCMVLSASRDDSLQVDAEIFRKALDILEATEVDMPMVYRSMGRTELAEIGDRILRFIDLCTEKLGHTTEVDILTQFYNDIEPMELRGLMRLYTKINRVSIRGEKIIAIPPNQNGQKGGSRT